MAKCKTEHEFIDEGKILFIMVKLPFFNGDGQIVRQMDRQKDRQIDQQIDRQVDRQIEENV